jgi:teichuronic acid biosynthesis glycosyltransferase TuaC
MKKMIVFSNMYPSKEHPTYGIFVKSQVELLRAEGLEIDVIAIDDPTKGKAQTMGKYSWFLVRSIFYLMKNRKVLSHSHAHYAFPTGAISLLGKKLFGIPYVVTVHGGDIDQMSKKSTIIATWTKKVLKSAGFVIVVGEQLKKDVIQKFEVKEDHLKVISMGVDTDIFKPTSKQDSRKKIGIANHTSLILYVGNIIKSKGILELINSFALLKEQKSDLKLVLIGSQKDEEFVESVRTIIQEKALSGIQMLQPLDQRELTNWVSSADALTLPSHHEGFGLVALEAMAMSIPVVGSDVGGLSYLLNQNAGILVQPKDVQSLKNGIEMALDVDSNSIEWDEVRNKVKKHSYKNIVKELIELYKLISK